MTVPKSAMILLDFIGSIEAPKGYGTIYGNNQGKLAKPLTDMTLDEVQAAQRRWSKNYGSSASGRYQFMRATLAGLMAELGLRGSQHFNAELQDALGYHLLKRRGFNKFIAGQMTLKAFGLELAKEWASLPVLETVKGAHRTVERGVERGETYYAGDKLNKSLVKPMDVEVILAEVLNEAGRKPTPPAPPAPPPPATSTNAGIVGWLILAFTIVSGLIVSAWEHVANFFGGLF